ncbi:hypothetical protein HDR63_01955 [bacterium]|nr:hypothetical protein [bacterium]
MNEWMNTLVGDAVQCWGCPVFDRLFGVISDAAAAAYRPFVTGCIVIFCVLFAFFVINAVWQNLKSNMSDPWLAKSVQPMIASALFALTFLSMGVYVPRFVTTITFEPVAEMAVLYSQSVIRMDNAAVDARVDYQPERMANTGFFRPQLRNTIIQLMKTTITQFQAYIKLGIAVMDRAFSWDALLGVGALIRHVIMFLMGLYLVYGFFKLFVRFCFYFADVIVAMTYFAFFFPLSLVLFAFRDSGAPKWMTGLGKTVGVDQFKKVINAIIGLASAVLTYAVSMMLIAKFFGGDNMSGTDLTYQIMSGDVFAGDLSDGNVAVTGLMGAVVLVYVVNFISGLAPQVTKMVTDTFGVAPETKIGDAVADSAMGLTKSLAGLAGRTVKAIANGGEEKKDDAKDNKKADGK